MTPDDDLVVQLDDAFNVDPSHRLYREAADHIVALREVSESLFRALVLHRDGKPSTAHTDSALMWYEIFRTDLRTLQI